MDFRTPGLTARFTTNTIGGVAKRDSGRFTTNVPHLKTDEPPQYEINGAQKLSCPELNWKTFFDYAEPALKSGKPVNVTIVTWENGDRGDTGDYAPVDFDNGEIVMISGLYSIDPKTKTFTVTNELFQAGKGMSGGVALLEIEGEIFEIGQFHGIADGNKGRRDQLRFVRSDSSNIESFVDDIETAHGPNKQSNGKAKLERHAHGIQFVNTNRNVAEFKAQKSNADKHNLQQRKLKEKRKAEQAAAKAGHKEKAAAREQQKKKVNKK